MNLKGKFQKTRSNKIKKWVLCLYVVKKCILKRTTYFPMRIEFEGGNEFEGQILKGKIRQENQTRSIQTSNEARDKNNKEP